MNLFDFYSRDFKEGELVAIFKTAKKEGATLPRGILKEASEFDKQYLNNIVANSKLDKCKIRLYNSE